MRTFTELTLIPPETGQISSIYQYLKLGINRRQATRTSFKYYISKLGGEGQPSWGLESQHHGSVCSFGVRGGIPF